MIEIGSKVVQIKDCLDVGHCIKVPDDELEELPEFLIVNFKLCKFDEDDELFEDGEDSDFRLSIFELEGLEEGTISMAFESELFDDPPEVDNRSITLLIFFDDEDEDEEDECLNFFVESLSPVFES